MDQKAPPTLYLDQNHLSMVSSVSGPVTLDLRERLDALLDSGRAQLVISYPHVLETAKWENILARDALVEWVDAKRPLWAPWEIFARKWEAIQFVRGMLGATDVAAPNSALLPALFYMSGQQLHDMGTALPFVQHQSFRAVILDALEDDGFKALVHSFASTTIGDNASLLAGNSMSPERQLILHSTIDAVMMMGAMPDRIDGRRLDAETLRRFVERYARADARVRRFSAQITSALASVRRTKLPPRPLDGVHVDDYIEAAKQLGPISLNDVFDKEHARAALFVDVYACDRAFSHLVRTAVRGLSGTARVFARLSEGLDALEGAASGNV